MAAADLREEYQRYLARFTAELGDEVEPGAFVKYRGRLIKKMDFEEFARIHEEYHQLAAHYFESLDRGDTINDIVVKSIREDAAHLVLTAPV
jgi:hypothetical protein